MIAEPERIARIGTFRQSLRMSRVPKRGETEEPALRATRYPG